MIDPQALSRAVPGTYDFAESAAYSTPEYVELYGVPPHRETSGARTWFARAQHYIVAYSEVEPGAELVHDDDPDEHIVILPDRSTTVDITTADGPTKIDGYTLTIVPPGDSSISVVGRGRLIQIFTSLTPDLVERCPNADSYATPHENVAALEPWPDPVGGFKLRSYSLDVPDEPGRFGKLFRSTKVMVNFLDGHHGPRDPTKLSPHSHDDFEQCSLVLAGEWVHHIRWPWTSNLADWIEDHHHRIGAPSVTVIPPPAIHTSQSIDPGHNQLLDFFSPPRRDLSETPGWVLNADDYPMP
jgi:hypothetical protein